MSSKTLRRSRSRGRGRYDYDDLNRGRDRRVRSLSRESRDTRLHKKDVRDADAERSPSRRKKHDMLPPSTRRRSRGRSRSIESRRSNRHDDRSPHRSKRHRRSQSPRHGSHRHRKRHASISPVDKRRRSRSPGHSSVKHKRPRRPRTRSRSSDNRSRPRDLSVSPAPRKHKSSTRSNHRKEETPSFSPSRRHGSSQPRNLSPRLRHDPSPDPWGYSPVRLSHSELSPPLLRIRNRSPRNVSPPRRESKQIKFNVRQRFSRSRSPPPFRDLSPRQSMSLVDTPKYSPPPMHLRTPSRRMPRHPADTSPLRQSPPTRPIRPSTDRRDQGHREHEDYGKHDPGQRSQNLSPLRARSLRRLSQSRSPPDRRSISPDRPGQSASASQQHMHEPETTQSSGPYVNPERQRNFSYSIDRGDRGSGRSRGGRGRGRGRGHDHHRNQPLGSNYNDYPPRGRGTRGRGSAHHSDIHPHSQQQSYEPSPPQDPTSSTPNRISPDRRSNDHRTPALSYGRGSSRGGFHSRGRGDAGSGRRELSPDPMNRAKDCTNNNKEPDISEEKPFQDGGDMPPPSHPASRSDQPATRPFKRVLDTQPIPRAPAAETKGVTFRPFTMNLPPKNPKSVKAVPKALDAHLCHSKFATGSNSAPLGKNIDLSARLGRVNDTNARKVEIRDANRDTCWSSPIRSPPSASRRSSISAALPPLLLGPEIIYKEMPIYHRVSMVGEGTYGKVYKASNNLTKELVALKRIRMENEKDGFPITAVREMRLLQALKHENIVSLLEMMVEKSDFYMVFDYMDHDLTGILNHPTFRLEPAHIKHLARQFFDALHYLHHRGVLHRDIKGSNILLNNDGQLKIADFGLARFYTKNSKTELDYTNRIITLWYRPPEILLGVTAYGPAVDMWSAACVFIELFTRAPAFPGRTEIDQLDIIYDVLGRPTEKVWPALKQMPWYSLLRTSGLNRKNRFTAKYEKQLPPSAMDLITSLLQYDPDKRPTAEDCLKHVYFSEEPTPAPPLGLRDLKGDWHEYESKIERRKEREVQKKRYDVERKRAKEAREVERKRAGQQEYDPDRQIESMSGSMDIAVGEFGAATGGDGVVDRNRGVGSKRKLQPPDVEESDSKRNR